MFRDLPLIGAPPTFGLQSNLHVILTASALVLAVLLFSRKRTYNAPPSYNGFIPWLGCAISFGKDPLEFIEKKRKELGPIFSLYVAGERMTFLTKPEHFSFFFDETLVDFQKAVKDVVTNIASLDQQSFFTYHTKVHDIVRGKLASSKLNGLEESLCHQFNININKYVKKNVQLDLLHVVRFSMYRAIVNNLFGDDHECLQINNEGDFQMFVEHFLNFDQQFERGARLPSVFLPKWTKAKQFLLNTVGPITTRILKDRPETARKKTLLEEYVSVLDKKCASNYAVLLLWASLANAIPITFWTLAHILGNKQIEERLRRELEEEFKGQGQDSMIHITREDLKKVPYLKYCVMEAIRIQSVGVLTRRVTKDFKIEDYVIEKDTMLMISPYWNNRDEELFHKPEVYMPERWEERGTSWFALMEIELYVALFLLKFNSTVHSPIPKADLSHIVGSQQPKSPFYITCE